MKQSVYEAMVAFAKKHRLSKKAVQMLHALLKAAYQNGRVDEWRHNAEAARETAERRGERVESLCVGIDLQIERLLEGTEQA